MINNGNFRQFFVWCLLGSALLVKCYMYGKDEVDPEENCADNIWSGVERVQKNLLKGTVRDWHTKISVKYLHIPAAITDNRVRSVMRVSKSLRFAVNWKYISRILSPDWTRVGVGYQKMSFLCTADKTLDKSDVFLSGPIQNALISAVAGEGCASQALVRGPDYEIHHSVQRWVRRKHCINSQCWC